MITESPSSGRRNGGNIAKLRTALFAFSIKGTIAHILTFCYLPPTQISKAKLIPSDPRTPAQLAQRNKFLNCVTQWKDLTPDVKQDYINQAKGYPQTALSLFLHACLLASPTTATLHGYFPGVITPGSNVIIRLFTPGTQTETYKAAAPTDASDYFDITTIPPGTYDVGIKTDASLSELVTNQVFVAGETTNVTFPHIRLGDLNNDDYVTAADRSIIYWSWNQCGACQGYPGNWLMP